MKTSNCNFCGKEFKYRPQQSRGKFCSTECSGNSRMIHKFKEDTTFGWSMSKYLKKKANYTCEECGVKEWNGKELTMQVDHINGNRRDNRFSNLKVLCPNCHSQTNTFASRNVSEEGRAIMKQNALNNFHS